MFTAAIILMEMKRPRGQRRCVHGVNKTRPQKNAAISMIRDLQIPGEHYDPTPSYTKKSYYHTQGGRTLQVNETVTKIPSEHFCESLHIMHGNDQAGLVLVNRPPPNLKSTMTTTAVVNPVPVRVAKQLNDEEDFAGEKGKEVDGGYVTASKGRRQFGTADGLDGDFKFKLVNDLARFPGSKLGQDGDRLATLQDAITMKKEKRRMVLEQIIKLEEKKRRFISNTHHNQGKLRFSQQKREKLERHAQSKVDHRWQQVVDLEKDKVTMEEKLDKFEDIGLALAMQKEEKHRCLLEIIDNAPGLYRKESENLEERQQREIVRYRVVMGMFLALFAVLLVTYISRFGLTEKSATDGGMFY